MPSAASVQRDADRSLPPTVTREPSSRCRMSLHATGTPPHPLLLARRCRSNLPYGEGYRLRLRSAISHLNEVWAVETGGIILSSFASVLPWEWIRDAARWTYDESRRCRMGRDRLTAWGYMPEELPLGNYIYLASPGEARLPPRHALFL